MKQAIQKAIEGGWKPLNLWDDPIHKASTGGDFLFSVKGDEYSKDGRELIFLKLEQITQDPLFWKALSKAMGWKKTFCPCGQETDDYRWAGYCNEHSDSMLALEEWKHHWHNF